MPTRTATTPTHASGAAGGWSTRVSRRTTHTAASTTSPRADSPGQLPVLTSWSIRASDHGPAYARSALCVTVRAAVRLAPEEASRQLTEPLSLNQTTAFAPSRCIAAGTALTQSALRGICRQPISAINSGFAGAKLRMRDTESENNAYGQRNGCVESTKL